CCTGRHLSNGVLHGVSEPIEKRTSDEQFYSICSPLRQRSGETLARGFLSTPDRKAPSARADWFALLCGGDRERGKSDLRVPRAETECRTRSGRGRCHLDGSGSQ